MYDYFLLQIVSAEEDGVAEPREYPHSGVLVVRSYIGLNTDMFKCFQSSV